MKRRKRIIVEYQPQCKKEVVELLMDFNAEIVHVFNHVEGITCIIDESFVENLKGEWAVKSFEKDNHSGFEKPMYYNTIFDKKKGEYLFPFSYPLQKDIFGMSEAWKDDYLGYNVSCGIIDSGLDPKHPLLEGKINLFNDFSFQ